MAYNSDAQGHMFQETLNVSHTYVGSLAPVVSPPSATATSVTITWTQPEFSATISDYTITVTRRSTQTLCPSFVEPDQTATTQPDTMSTSISGLQEFSNYRVTVTANFDAFGMSSRQHNVDFTTLSASKKTVGTQTAYTSSS